MNAANVEYWPEWIDLEPNKAKNESFCFRSEIESVCVDRSIIDKKPISLKTSTKIGKVIKFNCIHFNRGEIKVRY